VPTYNAAATLYQLGRYVEAEAAYQSVKTKAGPLLRCKIDYALGNVAVALQRYDDAIGFYDACIAHPDRSRDAIRIKSDASENRKFAETLRNPPAARNEDGNRRVPTPKSQEKPDSAPSDPAPTGESSPQEPSTGNSGSSSENEQSTKPARAGGGSGADSPSSTRFQEMVDQVRRSQRRADDRSTPPMSAATDRKDW
jgi:tetratricopeptide (TPR) repeat protein